MSFVRPIGFTPAEISRLVNEEVVGRHAEEAAFLWRQRARAASAPHFSLQDLARLDERVEAHVQGLRASPSGWQHCERNLALKGPGEVFAAAVVAFDLGQPDLMRRALQAGCDTSSLRSGLISALGWLDFGHVHSWIGRLLAARVPLHRVVGLAAAVIHRQDPGPAMVAASVEDVEPVLRRRALRAIGELKLMSLRPQLQEHLHEPDDGCRFWAAWSLALLGERAGLTALMAFIDSESGWTPAAVQMAMRAMSLADARVCVSALTARPERARTAVMAAGAVGDPAVVPWLIRRMHEPALARLAGEAFTTITGADLALLDLDQDPPPPSAEGPDESATDEVVDPSYESNLRWPAPDLVAAWWADHRHSFTPGVRYLGGRAVNAAALVDVLRTGKQRQRVAASLHLALLERDRPLFEVRARGGRQQQALNVWIS
jgi:uncharacterized protein (TIGR02270 family)